jgi:hypothetical protein
MPAESEILAEVRERLRKLEHAASRPRGATNMAGAAAYLNRSREWLRREHAANRGPKRRRRGARGWDYSYTDLDEYREHGDSGAAPAA